MDNSLFSVSGPLLAIETSSRKASVALLVPGAEAVVQEHLAATEPTTRTLAPAIQRLLGQFSLSCRELFCVAVDYGPGSFTGLRVGIAFAKTLCFAARVPIVGIQSLELVADMAAEKAIANSKNKILVLVDAQRGQYYAAGYTDNVETYAPRIADENWIVDRCSEGWTLAGPGVEKLLQQTAVTEVTNATFQEPLAPDAASLAQSAVRRLDRLTTDVYRLQPLYIRPSAAEEKAASA